MKHSLYKKIYGGISSFIEKRLGLKKAMPIFDKVITIIFFVEYAFLCYSLFSKKTSAELLMGVLFPFLLTLLVVTVLRLAIPRPRPYTEEGAGITPLVKKKGDSPNSFPSRHVACAAVITCVFFPHFPLVAALLFFFTLLLAFVRFALGLHYISDLLAGGGIGFIIGLAFIIF